MSRSKRETELELIAEQKVEFASKAKKHFGPFVSYTMPTYESQWYNRELRKVLNDFAYGKIPKLMIFCPPQHGKEIDNSLPVLTLRGWRTHGKLKVGDSVFHPSGKPIKVLAVSPEVESDRKITFTNGQVIKTHSNHEWAINHRGKMRSPKYKTEVLETKQIEKLNYWELQASGKSRAIYQLPDTEIIQFTEKELIIHPYLLGAWLGDGESRSPKLTLNKEDAPCMAERVSRLGYDVTWLKEQPTTQNIYLKDQMETFRALNLLNNKHIPKKYEISSLEQRLQLLAGFIDADGYYYPKNGRYTLSNTNKQVIESLSRILETLNIRSTVAEFEPRLSSGGIQGKQMVYQLTFNTELDIPCVVPRKRNSNPLKVKRKVGIKKIENLSDGSKGKCIQVDSPDGLYLVGETLIPTHNSQLVSRHLPAFILGIDPTKQIAGVSYSGDFAKRFSRDAKRIIASPEYLDIFPETRINNTRRRDQDEASTANMYEIIKHRGCHQTVGVGGLLTGVTVDIGIIDDIIKDSVEANSETTRQNHWDWYDTVFTTRLHNKSQQLITFTRWHEDDLAGRLLQQEGDEWVVVNLPCLYEDNDSAWNKDPRKEGECLWPSRHSQERMESKRDKNPRTFAALYQQRPAPEDGIIIDVEDFQYYDPDMMPHFTEIIQTWDCSFKGKITSDWVVGQIWGRIGAKYYLIDQTRGKWGIKKTMDEIIRMTAKYPKARVKMVEDAANGPAIIEILQEHITGLIPKTPDKDKESRAKAVAHCVESHNVYLPLESKRPWVKSFVQEWRSFPNGSYDDQVDASTQAWHRFETKRKLVNVSFGIITKTSKFGSNMG